MSMIALRACRSPLGVIFSKTRTDSRILPADLHCRQYSPSIALRRVAVGPVGVRWRNKVLASRVPSPASVRYASTPPALPPGDARATATCRLGRRQVGFSDAPTRRAVTAGITKQPDNEGAGSCGAGKPMPVVPFPAPVQRRPNRLHAQQGHARRVKHRTKGEQVDPVRPPSPNCASGCMAQSPGNDEYLSGPTQRPIPCHQPWRRQLRHPGLCVDRGGVRERRRYRARRCKSRRAARVPPAHCLRQKQASVIHDANRRDGVTGSPCADSTSRDACGPRMNRRARPLLRRRLLARPHRSLPRWCRQRSGLTGRRLKSTAGPVYRPQLSERFVDASIRLKAAAGQFADGSASSTTFRERPRLRFARQAVCAIDWPQCASHSRRRGEPKMPESPKLSSACHRCYGPGKRRA